MKHILTYLLFLFIASINISYSQVKNCQGLKTVGINSTPLYYSSENLRSDTMDVLKYTINLDITDFTNQKISGNTIVRFAPKINGQNKLRLDLLKLIIDSVKQNSAVITYGYNDTLLKVNLLTSLNTTDTSNVTVYYHGKPQGDPLGWGGFSFSGNYAYNLGVGFGAKPHNYGRVWFPCFDNFVEKSTYEFNIITDTSKRAYCNGALISDIKTGNKRTRQWVLNKEIPSYLASVAVADYAQVNSTINAANGILPIVIAARASDTIALKNGFIHLPNAILGYENYYGPYVWNRVGYCLVPFNSGAMEHPTNIAYPVAATGIAYESQIMAHELSHHWWGDLMTCETQEDMWLNEGMASYSERLFLEWTYNYAKYLAEVKLYHDDLIKYVHFKEKGFRAISGIPFQYTYGDHVYKKGADVAHTLRSYMGDVAFFNGLKYVLQQKAYKSMNSIEFRNLLQTSSGQNLTPFFDNWVLNGGWPHFSIDSVKTTGSSSPYTSTVYVKQKLHGAPALYTNVPLEITFMNSAWNKEIKTISMSGSSQAFTLQTNNLPAYAGINVDSKISDAISSEYKTIKTASNITYALGKVTILVSNKGLDSSYIRVEHNLAKADNFKNNTHNFRLNTQHYWKIDGILSSGFVSKVKFNYDGNKNTSGISYLDTCLTTINGDSLILLYRKNAADDWKEVSKYIKFKIGAKTGYVTADTLKLGEYVFANGKSSVIIGVNEKNKTKAEMIIFPNPSSTELTINLQNFKLSPSNSIDIMDMQGKLVKHIQNITNETNVDVSELSKAQYVINFMDKNKIMASQSIVVE